MPFDDKGRWYSDPESGTVFDLAPTYVTTSSTSTTFVTGAYDSIDATLGSHEFYVTSVAGSNNDAVWIARTPGTSPLTVTYVVSGTNTALTVVKSTNDLIVNVATNSSATATTTLNDVIDYINGNEAATAVEQAVIVQKAPGNDGTGVLAAMSIQSLAGPVGSSPTLDVSLEQTDDESNYFGGVAFTQITTATTQQKLFGPFADKARWKWVIGGTGSPAFVISIGAKAKRDT